ncbi:MAG: tetratricopeptide repeat protein [Planctomycetes bacterium]|nr:tetratricopeptide repeat protein [Planctomycetota bacterium]
MKIWKELKRLEIRVREEPSPTTFVDLGQVYINLESYDKALRVAEDGLALFPKATEMKKLLDCARRGLGKQRAAELKARLIRSPSPKLFREVAELQMDLGDVAALHATCQEWSLRFPDDAAAWLLLGQARLLGFYRDLAAREGREAVRCLDRAVRMNGTDDQARRLLGEVLYRVGAVKQAMQHLEVLRELQHDDAELGSLLEYVAGLEDHGDNVEQLFGEVEERGSLTHPPLAAASVASGEVGVGSIRETLGHIADIPGVRKATYIKGSRALVKGEIKDGRDPFLRIVRVIAKAAHRFGRRLDIGNACKNVVDGDFGHICVCVYGEVLAGVQCDTGTDIDLVLAELQEIVAGSLSPIGGNN